MTLLSRRKLELLASVCHAATTKAPTAPLRRHRRSARTKTPVGRTRTRAPHPLRARTLPSLVADDRSKNMDGAVGVDDVVDVDDDDDDGVAVAMGSDRRPPFRIARCS